MKNQNVAIMLIGLAIIIGGAYWLIHTKSNPDSDGVFCTADALLCPDGSGVGRSGPQCKFKACPNQSSFTGTLAQDGNGFKLILAAPDGAGDVSYSMPLIIKASNALGQLVGKKVRVYGTFTEGATLSVEQLEELTAGEENASLGEVKVGNSVFINGVKITLHKIVSDSRCSADVTCIWAGNVITNVTLESDTDKVTKNITFDASPTLFDSYQVSIDSVKPPRFSGRTLASEEYLITFKVVSNQ